MARVIQKKFVSPEGVEYDSREEYKYHCVLLSDERVSCIHRQVKLTISSAIRMRIRKPLKKKVRYIERTLINAHCYKPDFIFWEDGRLVVCDVKSTYTRSLREFRITAKGVIAKIVAHNRKRHDGKSVMVFREAVSLGRDRWRIIDYPPVDAEVVYPTADSE